MGEFVLDIDSPPFLDLSVEQKQLLSEFGTCYRSLVTFYENVRIDSELFSAASSTQNNEKYVFRARGGNHYRMDVRNTHKQQNGNENSEAKLFVTPNLYSTIRRSSPEDEFYASDVQTEKIS